MLPSKTHPRGSGQTEILKRLTIALNVERFNNFVHGFQGYADVSALTGQPRET
jgi:hypothetical protein